VYVRTTTYVVVVRYVRTSSLRGRGGGGGVCVARPLSSSLVCVVAAYILVFEFSYSPLPVVVTCRPRIYCVLRFSDAVIASVRSRVWWFITSWKATEHNTRRLNLRV